MTKQHSQNNPTVFKKNISDFLLYFEKCVKTVILAIFYAFSCELFIIVHMYSL